MGYQRRVHGGDKNKLIMAIRLLRKFQPLLSRHSQTNVKACTTSYFSTSNNLKTEIEDKRKPQGFFIKDSKGNIWGDDQAEFNNSWLLRLSHENDYLSWARNGYISSVAAFAILKIFLDDLSLTWARDAAFAVLGIAGLNTFGGGVYFLVTLCELRKAMLMPPSYFWWNVSHTVANMLLWGFMALLVFLNVSSLRKEEDTKGQKIKEV